MEKIEANFTINGRWDGDRSGTGTMIANGIKIPVSVPAGLAGPGIGSNPEELLMSSAATCYIITLAAILSKRNIKYSHLEINTEGLVEKEGNTLTFKEIIHKPIIFLNKQDAEKKQLVEQLTHRAEKACFISQSIKVPVSVQPEIRFE